MNGKVGVNVLKCLITAISIVIAMPGLWETDYRVVTLTLLVFYMSKIVEAVDGLDANAETFPLERVVKIFQCAIGIIAIAGCFYYLAVSISETGVKIITENPIIKNVYSACLVVAAAIFLAIDIFFCGITFYKNHRTVNEVMNIVNK